MQTWLLLVGGFLVLVVNSAYLSAFPAPSIFYLVNVAVHPLLGTWLAFMAYRQWRQGGHRISAPTSLVGGLALLCLLTGLAVLWFGATRPYRWLLNAHIAVSVAAGLVVLGLVVARLRHLAAGTARVLLASGIVLTLGVVAASTFVASTRVDARRAAYTVANAGPVPTSMNDEGAGPEGPFFPSSATTSTGGIVDASFFLTSEGCGRCHKDIYEQWRSSAHHLASFNNQWYRKSIEYMQDVVGTKPSKWCAGCHDHAVLFSGRFDQPIRDQIDTPEAQAGLGCVSCHAISHVKSTMGQGDFVIDVPPLHELASSEQPVVRWMHDKALALAPRTHTETFLKPFHTEQVPEFCSSCHKVHLDVPVNHYRWLRGFNDYDNWQASGVSGQGARSFYYPPVPQTCGNCHMPPVASNDPAARNGRVHSHRFAAANTALPFVNGDTAQLEEVQRFLRSGQVTVDIFGIVRGAEPDAQREGGVASGEPRLASTFAVGEEAASFGAAMASRGAAAAEVLAPVDDPGVAVARGESVRVEVVVRTRKVGHFFPAGTVDAFDVWVELEIVDDQGRPVFHSGYVEDGGKGPVEPGAHFYRSLQLDELGNPINKRNAWATRSLAYVRLIPPGAADTVHFRVRVPDEVGDTLRLRARVNYRKFAWWNTQWAFAGVRDPGGPDYSVGPGHDTGRWVFTGDTSRVSGATKRIPDLPITVVAEREATLRVVDPVAPTPVGSAPAAKAAPAPDASMRERWNDYGIGLLLQGDLRGAEAAFLKVTAIDPGYADGWVNVARVRVQEGNVAGAEAMVRKALALDAKLARAHFFLGVALKGLGRYDEALAHLREAAAQYPRDRVVLNQIGRVLFLDRQHSEAVKELRRVLEIDPEDLQAHYTLMLAYQALGDPASAERERRLYERFKADESSQAITGAYRQLHPDDNNERQAIHEHRAGARAVTMARGSR